MAKPVPSGWTVAPILHYVDLPDGQVDPRAAPYRSQPLIAPDHIEPATGRLLMIRSAQAQGAISGKYPFQAGDVLYSKIRPHLRKAVLADRDGVCSADMYPLKPRPGLHPRYLLAVILGEDFSRFAEAVSMRSGFPKINREELSQYSIWLPPFPEQRRMAEILDALDAAIRGTEALVAKLRVERAALHSSLVPVDAAGADWSTSILGNVVAGAEYGISRALSDHGAVPVLRMMNLKDGAIDLGDLKYSDSAEARGRLLRPGDILFNRTNSMEHVGRTSLWRGEHPAASFASYCVRFVAKAETILPAYLVRYMNLPDAQIRIKRLATPAVQQANVNPTQLQARFKVAFPRDLAVQQRAIDVLEAADAAIRAEEGYVAKLELQKQGLMQDLLTGRVRVNA